MFFKSHTTLKYMYVIIFLFIEYSMSRLIKPTSILASTIMIGGGICVYDGWQCITPDVGTGRNIFVEDMVIKPGKRLLYDQQVIHQVKVSSTLSLSWTTF